MKRSSIVGIFLLSFLAASCSIATSCFAQEKVVTLRYATFFPPTHRHAINMDAWCKEVEKRTNGAVKAKLYPGATLASAPQQLESVIKGVVDVSNSVIGYTMGKFPLTEVLDYPLGYPSGTVATRLANEYFKKFNPKEFSEVKVMYFHAQGPGLLHSKKPVTKLEDLKGVKMRTFGPNAKFMSSLGGIPIATPMGDAYDAISRGVAEGLLCAYEALEGWKLGEVVKYTTENYGSAYTAVFVEVMNKNKWDSISPQNQRIIEQINKEWIERTAKVWDEIDESGKQFIIKRGNKIIKLSAEEDARWTAKAQPLFDDYVKKTKEMNLPGDEVVKFARDFIKKNRK
jgi:TRAP-type C4-dicarboxylate transport system substrate-binding protein